MSKVVSSFFNKLTKAFGFATAITVAADYLEANRCQCELNNLEIEQSAQRLAALEELKNTAIRARAVAAQRLLLERTDPLMQIINNTRTP